MSGEFRLKRCIYELEFGYTEVIRNREQKAY